MSYDLSTPERYIRRLTKSIPFALATAGWDDILTLARQETDRPEFQPTRFWIVMDAEDGDKMGLALEESAEDVITTCVIDIKEPILTETQISLLKLMHLMTTPEYSVD